MSTKHKETYVIKKIMLSQNEDDYIEEQAAARDMTASEYIADCAVHRQQNDLTPELAVRAQCIVNTALDLAERLCDEDWAIPQTVELGELCRADSPLNKYLQMKAEIEKMKKGTEELWAYLQ